MDKYICMHGHFYQPPRENPWLEGVELQDSAYPYHDWNMRITEECYRQNAASRILGPERKILDIVNNYASMSFNFGPTLLYWLEDHAPDVYAKILEADHKSREKFSGHGSAIAQAYGHMIMPLANDRDRETQVLWGVKDFQQRFERDPEGMWLPETAVNSATLECLVEHGIKFTILAPRQAKRVRRIGEKRWTNVTEEKLDTSVPYVCSLPSGKSIVLFFYNGGVSHDIAYGGLLHNGENLANSLVGAFGDNGDQPSLVHIATDGESFGHHHHHGDMALAYCLHHVESQELAKITVYGEFLERFEPQHEVQIWEDSSWSCAHGVERWKSNCGCCADQSLCGQQQWREPLRSALDWLRDRLAGIFDSRMQAYCEDPWAARNEYVSVINDRSAKNVARFIADITHKELEAADRTTFVKLLELQRNAMLMYTSCGWFFDRISGIEAVQILKYADRAMQLCRELENVELEDEFKGMLEAAGASASGLTNGKEVYEAYVEPARIDLPRVVAHFALSSVFEEEEQSEADVYCYPIQIEDCREASVGVQVLKIHQGHVGSLITLEKQPFESAALYLGDQNLFAVVRMSGSPDDFKSVHKNMIEAFNRGENNEVMRIMNASFSGTNYSLSHLFKDHQREILNELLASTWEEIESSFRHIYDHNYPIMLMIRGANMPLPKALAAPAEFILNEDLSRDIESEDMDLDHFKRLVDEARRLSLDLDREKLSFVGSQKVAEMMARLEKSPQDVELLKEIGKTLLILRVLTPDLNLQKAQNIFFTLAKTRYSNMQAKVEAGDSDASQWVEEFTNLAQQLGLVVG